MYMLLISTSRGPGVTCVNLGTSNGTTFNGYIGYIYTYKHTYVYINMST